MNLGDMRDALADRVGWSHKRAQAVGRMLFADPVLFAIAGVQTDGSGQYGAAEPTPSALALLVIATLIEQPTSMSWHSGQQLHWHGRCWSEETDGDARRRPTCPVTGQVELGRMLAFVLRHPPCAARVIRLEVSRGGPVWSLWSKRHDAARVERTLFVAATGRALREALEDLPRAAFAALPGRVLFEIASVLARSAGK